MNESTASEGASADASGIPPEASDTTEAAGMPSARASTSADMSTVAVARAEELIDTVGQRLGAWAQSLEQGLRLLGARAREEAEDMLAEAQALRAGNGHQETTHARVVPTPHIERIDEEPPEQASAEQPSTDDATNAARPQDDMPTATEGTFHSSAETAAPTPGAADLP